MAQYFSRVFQPFDWICCSIGTAHGLANGISRQLFLVCILECRVWFAYRAYPSDNRSERTKYLGLSSLHPVLPLVLECKLTV